MQQETQKPLLHVYADNATTMTFRTDNDEKSPNPSVLPLDAERNRKKEIVVIMCSGSKPHALWRGAVEE